ncbi:MAG: UDP-N-acetylglucosamine 2-epimerase (non-hydrolyzing), partial [Dehalococcoidia bacterium]
PKPDYNLGVGSGTQGAQTGRMLIETEKVLVEKQPDWVFVYGDTNSALAGALAAAKLHTPVAHVEAGLRSFDRGMPEEINRLVADQVSDLLFTPSEDGNENLSNEGIPAEKVHFVGNVMIDTLVSALAQEDRLHRAGPEEAAGLLDQLDGRPYILVTLHRPSNVDDPPTLQAILSALLEVSRQVPVIFPMHPRTRQRVQELAPLDQSEGLHILNPCGYFDFLALMRKASVVVTDSGGIQEETTYLGIPCLTVRPNTERPVTITQGTNRLVASRHGALVSAIQDALRQGAQDETRQPPALWDGQAGQRIVDVFLRNHQAKSRIQLTGR